MQPQTKRLGDYLMRHGKIDPLTAWRKLGIYRLGARIYDLRKGGFRIDRRMKKVRTRDGDTTRVAEYSLA